MTRQDRIEDLYVAVIAMAEEHGVAEPDDLTFKTGKLSHTLVIKNLERFAGRKILMHWEVNDSSLTVRVVDRT